MRELTAIVLAMVFVFIVAVTFFAFDQSFITGNSIADRYSYTKAICNSTNYCQDYVVTCHGTDVLSVIPTGDVVQFPETWNDLRDNQTRDKLC